jgi:cullin 3
VEAAIVRIMKARKTLEHNQLVIEVTKQMSHRFVTDANFIKKR